MCQVDLVRLYECRNSQVFELPKDSASIFFSLGIRFHKHHVMLVKHFAKLLERAVVANVQ